MKAWLVGGIRCRNVCKPLCTAGKVEARPRETAVALLRKVQRGLRQAHVCVDARENGRHRPGVPVRPVRGSGDHPSRAEASRRLPAEQNVPRTWDGMLFTPEKDEVLTRAITWMSVGNCARRV